MPLEGPDGSSCWSWERAVNFEAAFEVSDLREVHPMQHMGLWSGRRIRVQHHPFLAVSRTSPSRAFLLVDREDIGSCLKKLLRGLNEKMHVEH